MSKYHATKVQSKDGEFDSKREYARWCELKLLERAGKISDLRRQIQFELIPGAYEIQNGRRVCVERPVKYIADFVYYEKGQRIVEDCKGQRTQMYIIKRKLMLNRYGIKIRET